MKNKSIFIGSLIYFSMFSIIGIGFSSWVSVNNYNSNSDVNVNVGEVKENLTINEGIYYIFKSEYAFDYFKINKNNTD